MSILGVLKKQKWFWLSGVMGVVAIKLASLNHNTIEKFYSENFYFYFSVILRFLIGWIPFSLGDVLYFIAGIWIFWKVIKNVVMIFKKQLTRDIFIKKVSSILMLFVSVYIIFNIFWGLNYNRDGLAFQLQLPVVSSDTSSMIEIQNLLLQKVNETKTHLLADSGRYPDNNEIFKRARKCYDEAEVVFPFLAYDCKSVKSSMYGLLGDYLGFTGYYNPFTGEAQVNTTVPRFLIPYIVLHEMGHQLGYAKEDEANFCGYLAAAHSSDTLFQYSAYLDLFVYANREVYFFDSLPAKSAASQLIPAVKADIAEWKNFNRKYRSAIEPAITWLYGKYLQANHQPKGIQSYDDVITSLIAYYKKSGSI